MGRRPELEGPPELFYNAGEAGKYARSSRIACIQREMASRALELLALPSDGAPRLVLDLGCGSGLSGRVLAEAGHAWVGVDISRDMLSVASADTTYDASDDQENEPEDDAQSSEDDSDGSEQFSSGGDGSDNEMSDGSESDADMSDGSESDAEIQESDKGKGACPLSGLVLGDMGDGVAFRPGTFDGCISVSALQWLCHANSARENPRRRLARLFSTLFAALARGARAVFQVYPQDGAQLDLMLAVAARCGFSGGLVVDYPHSAKAKKFYLVLMTAGGAEGVPPALGERSTTVDVARRRTKQSLRRSRKGESRREWVVRKKERSRARGDAVRRDSRYTARKRRSGF